jgi:anti-anti-sigma factor
MSRADYFLTERHADTLIIIPMVNLSELEYDESATQAIYDQFHDATIKNVVFDFYRTDYFGSTALGFFVRVWKRVTMRNGRMAFANLSQHEAEILRVTKLDTHWAICASRADALAAVQAKSA